MDKASGVKEFFDISDKLSAPAKKSLRERQKEEAEAKRKREEEEAKVALRDFQKSLGVEDDDDDDASRPNDSGPARIGAGRHFTPRGPRGNSGPGSLGPPPPSLARKRAADGSQKDRDQGLFAFSNSGPLDAATAFRDSDDEDYRTAGPKGVEKAIPKPTMRLSSLPPSITTAEIKSMIPSTLTVEAVNISKNVDNRSRDRRSTSAIVTLAQNTPAKDIDAVVNALEKRYLGFGFNLSISRHLSSASIDTPGPGIVTATPSSLPFGAKSTPGAPGQSMSRAPPPPSLRNAPPPYGSSQNQYGRSLPTHVMVKPPSDIKQLKLINKTIESLLNNGPEFEALLMSRPDVQRDQKWEWLWNARSLGGVWYRWKLWQTITGEEATPAAHSRFKALEHRVFYDSAPWTAPEQPLPFEFTTRLEEFASDPEYDSSDEEASDDEGARRPQHISGGPPETSFDNDDALKSYLNPLRKAKLTHLLARLPTSTARLRRGDIARVSSFAISHADKGADEIVNMLITNIQKPLALSSANPDRQKQEDEAEKTEQDENGDKKTEKEDPSSAKLIGLYIVSDIFASCGTCGVRQAWRYREWFEAAFKKRKLFEHLGRLEKDLQWGRLRAEKWKRSINNVLSMWDGGNVFSPAAQAHFVEVFNNPPLTESEKQAIEKAEQEAARAAAKSKWKTVDVKADITQDKPKESLTPVNSNSKKVDIDGEPMEEEDVDGEPLDNGDVDGQPMDEDVDGEPMEDVQGDKEADDNVDGEPMEEENAGHAAQGEVEGTSMAAGETEAAKARRRRPRAEDMFADSEDE